MADKKISALTAASTPLAGTEVLPIVQSSTTVKVATDDLTVKNFRSNATTGILQVTGPGAGTTRTMTVPNANFTAARTDAAQTFTGAQTFDSVVVNNASNGAGIVTTGTTGAAVNQYITLNHSPGGGAYAYTNLQISGVDVFSSGKQLSTYAGNTTINAPYSTGAIIFKIDGTQYSSITSSGNYKPIAAKGIDYSANTGAAGMTSQLLNWYEEGTWTPGQGGGLTVVGTFGSSGKYTRIGRMVVAKGVLTATTSLAWAAGAAEVTNSLPFTTEAEYPASAYNGAYNATAALLASNTQIYSVEAMAATASVTFCVTYFV